MDVKETDDGYTIEAAAPGMKKKDFKINYHNHVLTISSERQEEKRTRMKITAGGNSATDSSIARFLLRSKGGEKEKKRAGSVCNSCQRRMKLIESGYIYSCPTLSPPDEALPLTKWKQR